MTITSDNRALLPLLPSHDGGTRSALTCRYRCGDACFHDVPNTSGNEYFGDVAARAFSRRTALKAGAVVAAAGAATTALAAPAAADGAHGPSGRGRPGRGATGLAFEPVAPNTADAITVPPGYAQEVVIRWGDALFADSPAFDPDNQTAHAQARQFGYNCDHLGFLTRGREEVMVVNHEYTDEVMMFPGYDAANPTREHAEIAWAAHGLSVVAVSGQGRGRRSGGYDAVVGHRLNRRFTATSAFELAGPVAGAELVRTSADPEGYTVRGTLNNCAGGLTPWNTWLTAEENFNQYFANANAVTEPVTRERLRRYGLPGGASERKWERFDNRFDLAQEPNEVNRFGWIVEVDPFDPTSTPKKRTALGRFKHEAATIRLTRDGRVVAYMGDDERFDYIYKFVSRDRVKRDDAAHNATLLDNGTLYVARLSENGGDTYDGSGEWIPLVRSDDGGDRRGWRGSRGRGRWNGHKGSKSFVPGMSVEEVLLFTRQAGDAVGATKMDRPEDVEPSPTSGTVYVALTNNTNRSPEQVDGPNPRANNKHGHVLEIEERRNDPAETRFGWRIFLICGDPQDPSTYFAGFDKSQVSPISCPDNLAFDPYGNLWISTDGAGGTLATNDALHAVAVTGAARGQVKTFLTVPRGAETCGPVVTDRRVLVCVQHPGEIDGATYDNRLSHWPDGGAAMPRPSVVVSFRLDGKKIGEV